MNLQHLLQKLPGEAGLHLGYLVGGALGDDLAAARAAARAQVDDPVGAFHHVQVVFNDNHGVAQVAKPTGFAQAGDGQSFRLSFSVTARCQ